MRLALKFRLASNLAGFIPNLLGAFMIIIFYQKFNFATRYSFNIFEDVPYSLYVTLLVFFFIMLHSLKSQLKIKAILGAQEKNQASPKEITLLKNYVFNYPMRNLSYSLIGWLAAALFVPLAQLVFYDLQAKAFIHVFLVTFFIGGSMSMAVSFFISDSLTRRFIPQLFPDGDFSGVKTRFRLKIYLKIVIALWITAIFPLFLQRIFSQAYLELSRLGELTPAITAQYETLERFLLFLSVFFAVLFSIYFSRNIGRPLLHLSGVFQTVARGELNITLPVRSDDEIGILESGFNHMLKGLVERERIKEIFGKYVSAQVRDTILQQNPSLGGQRKDTTILFSDIRRFTDLSEQIEASELVAFLNGFFSGMVEVITLHQGYVDKFIGDAVMAVFDTLPGSNGHAERAVRAGLGMLSQLELFNESRKNQGLASIEIGIGINTGEVVAGNIGSHDRMEYTVIGEAVNIASRIESLSKNYQTKLLITEATYGQIKTVSDFVCQKLDLVKVKGISRDIQIYGVAI